MTKDPKTPALDPGTHAPTAPPEGPHARADLIDPEKTPGSGMFPKPGTKDAEPPAG
ncbi:MAG: hypothetical protein Q8O26_17025 [Phreatobacter sp.]|uniref:hypothetical protein n=1 Tax=Phreatobacter sp. TaxID=1966341 RepID=UPI0027342035|nr:hypothetical protein [Phreatobacter sp.]MDP2803574.1 hypothetical protein [Phreatobacter sp.]